MMMYWVKRRDGHKETAAAQGGGSVGILIGAVVALALLAFFVIGSVSNREEADEVEASPSETSEYGTLPYQAVEWASTRIAEYGEEDELPFSEVWNRLEPSLADSGVTATISGMNGLPASYEEYCLTADDGETSAFYSSEDGLIVEGATGDSYACGSWR